PGVERPARPVHSLFPDFWFESKQQWLSIPLSAVARDRPVVLAAARRTMKLPGVVACLLLVGMAVAEPGDGSWLRKVPDKDRARSNPLENDPDAAAAGAKVYAEHCASCHGDDAEGKMHGRHYRPNLHSKRVKEA